MKAYLCRTKAAFGSIVPEPGLFIKFSHDEVAVGKEILVGLVEMYRDQGVETAPLDDLIAVLNHQPSIYN